MQINEDQAHPFVASRRQLLQACAVVVGAGMLAALAGAPLPAEPTVLPTSLVVRGSTAG